MKINLFVKNRRINVLRKKIYRVVFFCTLIRMWGIARTLIFRQYYCLWGILGIGTYLEAVRRKILRVIHRFLMILTIEKKNINARRNKSFFFHPSSKNSSFIQFVANFILSTVSYLDITRANWLKASFTL